MTLMELLTFSIQQQASDLHLSAGLPPMLRILGDMQQSNLPPIESKDILDYLAEILPTDLASAFHHKKEVDFAWDMPGGSRCRIHAFHQARGPTIAIRMIPHTLPAVDLSAILPRIHTLQHGLVLVTGPTGSGKSTTLAAIIAALNKTRAAHIITLEDPIEFQHHSERCLIQQREIHSHTHDFPAALRSALRADPDIILIGEMRDPETVRLALTAAETGHLVFATLHTGSAATTLHRIIDVFPAGEKELIRTMLAESLQMIISQTLVKNKQGGRIAASEILLCTPAIRHLIRENKVTQIYSALQTGRTIGMRTLDMHLQELVAAQHISPMTANNYALNKEAFV